MTEEKTAICNEPTDERIVVNFQLSEELPDDIKLMAIWHEAYTRYGAGLSLREREAAKNWFDAWYASQQKDAT